MLKINHNLVFIYLNMSQCHHKTSTACRPLLKLALRRFFLTLIKPIYYIYFDLWTVEVCNLICAIKRALFYTFYGWRYHGWNAFREKMYNADTSCTLSIKIHISNLNMNFSKGIYWEEKYLYACTILFPYSIGFL